MRRSRLLSLRRFGFKQISRNASVPCSVVVVVSWSVRVRDGVRVNAASVAPAAAASAFVAWPRFGFIHCAACKIGNVLANDSQQQQQADFPRCCPATIFLESWPDVMGCFGSASSKADQEENKRRKEANKKINQQIQKDKQVYRATHRLLLLGMCNSYNKTKSMPFR